MVGGWGAQSRMVRAMGEEKRVRTGRKRGDQRPWRSWESGEGGEGEAPASLTCQQLQLGSPRLHAPQDPEDTRALGIFLETGMSPGRLGLSQGVSTEEKGGRPKASSSDTRRVS